MFTDEWVKDTKISTGGRPLYVLYVQLSFIIASKPPPVALFLFFYRREESISYGIIVFVVGMHGP